VTIPVKIFGQTTVDDEIISILAGYIASGSSLSEIENISLIINSDALTVTLHGKTIMITTNDQRIEPVRDIVVILNRLISESYMHILKTNSIKEKWITFRPINKYYFAGAFIGFYLISNNPVDAMDKTIDIIKTMGNDNPVSGVWERLNYYRMYKRLLEATERLLSRSSLLEIQGHRNTEILIGFMNDDLSVFASKIIVWGRNTLSTPPVRIVSIKKLLPGINVKNRSFICLDIGILENNRALFECNDRYCCVFGGDPIKLIIKLEKFFSSKKT